MKYEFVDINNFIVANGSADHYEADLKLYEKLFPESPILKTLRDPFPPQKKELDERMLFEILNADRICMETILENRGILIPQVPASDPANEVPANTESFVKTLMGTDVETLKYNEAKALAFGLKLDVADQKMITLKNALAKFKALPDAPTDVIVETQGIASDHVDVPTEEKKS